MDTIDDQAQEQILSILSGISEYPNLNEAIHRTVLDSSLMCLLKNINSNHRNVQSLSLKLLSNLGEYRDTQEAFR